MDVIAKASRVTKRGIYYHFESKYALVSAKRRLSHPDPGDALLESLCATSLMALAGALREGKISSASHGELAEKLLDYLESELAITNPKFLERRKV
jgi:AcrR family transcriptional regulator